MKLGVYLFSNSQFDINKSFPVLVEQSKFYDRAGIDTLWIAETLLKNNLATPFSHYEAYSLLTALTQHTHLVKFGSLVTPYVFHNLGVLAKQIASIDHMSNGRIIAGMGLGEYNDTIQNWGIPKKSVPFRFNEFEEYVRCLKALFEGEVVSSELFQLNDVSLNPLPLKKHIPILIGGGGEKHTLRLVAKYADLSNCFGSIDSVADKHYILNQWCDKFGRNPNDITKTTMSAVVAGRNQQEVEKEIKKYCNRIVELGGRRPSLEEFTRNRLTGTIEDITEQIDQYKEIGIDQLILTVNTGQSRELIPELVKLV